LRSTIGQNDRWLYWSKWPDFGEEYLGVCSSDSSLYSGYLSLSQCVLDLSSFLTVFDALLEKDTLLFLQESSVIHGYICVMHKLLHR
jgi:hypothetical protein